MPTTLSARGQTVIPAAIRKSHHIELNSTLEWIDDGKCIRVIPVSNDTIGEARAAYGKGTLGKALLKSRAEDRTRG